MQILKCIPFSSQSHDVESKLFMSRRKDEEKPKLQFLRAVLFSMFVPCFFKFILLVFDTLRVLNFSNCNDFWILSLLEEAAKTEITRL